MQKGDITGHRLERYGFSEKFSDSKWLMVERLALMDRQLGGNMWNVTYGGRYEFMV